MFSVLLPERGNMAFVSLKYDDVFREVFSHENILKRFISDVTGISLEEICSVKISSPAVPEAEAGDS